MPRRVLQDGDETGRGLPPLLRSTPQFSGELEVAVPPPLPISGHVTKLHAGSRRRGEGSRGGDGLGEAGQGLAAGEGGVSRTSGTDLGAGKRSYLFRYFQELI